MRAALPVEIEIKLALDPGAVLQALEHPAVVAIARGRRRRIAMAGRYFDTADWRLARAGIALRVRREGRRWVQAIKGRAQDAAGGLATRVELEWPLGAADDAPPLALERLRATAFRAAIDDAVSAGLAPRFETAFERTSLPVAFSDGTRATFCVDVGEIRAGESRLPLCEIEIELAGGAPRRLIDLAQALAADLPVMIEPRSKAERGHALAQSRAIEAFHAESVVFKGSERAAQAIARIVQACLRQIERNAPGVAAGDAECIHQLRVGARRLRSVLALLKRDLPAKPLRDLAGDARWLARALGDARDLHVLCEETLPALARERGNGPDSREAAVAAASSLQAALATRIAQARASAHDAVRSPRLARLALGLVALCATPALGVDASSRAARRIDGPAREYAVRALDRRYRALRRRGRGLRNAPPEERHRARIAAKRLRYLSDFFGSLFDAPTQRPFVAALADLQQALGRDQDVAVAVTHAHDALGDVDPRAADALAQAAQAGAKARTQAIRKAWKALRACAPFWRDSVETR